VTALKSVEVDRSFWTWYWGGPWADPVEPVRDDETEQRIAKALADYRAANPR